jgi:hypothetical protein
VISKPNSKTTKNLVWLPEEGKEKILDSPLLTEFLNAGYTVISTDLPGVGELNDPTFKWRWICTKGSVQLYFWSKPGWKKYCRNSGRSD